MTRARGWCLQCRAFAPALIALGLLLTGGPSLAADPGPARAPAAAEKSKRSAPAALVDINSASRAQLKALPGIGDAEAGRIIAGRPYFSKADLATKQAIPTGIYLQIKDRIIAVQRQKPKGRN